MSLAALNRIRAAPAPAPRRVQSLAFPCRAIARGSRDDDETSGDEGDGDVDEDVLDAEAGSGTDDVHTDCTPTASAASSPPAAVPLIAAQKIQRTFSAARERAPGDRGVLAAPRRAAKRAEVPPPPPPPARPIAPQGDGILGPWLATVTASTLAELPLFAALPPPADVGGAQALVAVPAGARVAMSNAHRVMDEAGNVWGFVKWVDASAAVFSGWARIVDGASKAASLGSFSV